MKTVLNITEPVSFMAVLWLLELDATNKEVVILFDTVLVASLLRVCR